MSRHTAILAALLAGCSSLGTGTTGGGKGRAQIIVAPEDTIPNGLDPGAGPDKMEDGWKIRYQRFLLTIGNIKASRSDAPGDVLADPTVYVLDLKNAPTTGYVLKEFLDATAARYDRFGFDIPNARVGAKLLAPTAATDLELMTRNAYAIYFEGTAERPGADKISFKWGFKTGTSFADCASADGQPGFAVPQGGGIAVKPTIHGDHVFFTNVTQGAEITERRAEWIKICDRNADRDLTIDELKACPAADAFPPKPAGPYDLTGVKDQDGDGKITAYDYVDSQLRTLGDFQGDGECPTRTHAP